MSTPHPIDAHLARYPLLAAAAYGLIVLVFVVVGWSALSDLNERRLTLSASAGMLGELERRDVARPAPAGVADEAPPQGSAFLDGETVTVAGAALLQRVVGAITRAGGNVVSSQVELAGAQFKDGRVGIIASCEIDEPRLQEVLYNLEAGMPFLFVEQLVAQPVAATLEAGSRIRVLLTVSGQWRGAS
jgi:general secretion pathway protein M